MSDALHLTAAIFGPMLSSVAWITEQEAVSRLGPLPVAAVSSLSAGLILAAYSRIRQRIPSGEKIRAALPELISVTLLRNILGFLCFVFALSITSSAKIMFLTKMEPYLVILVHWVRFGERVAREHLWLLAIHVCGAVLLSTGGQFSFQFDQFGDLLVVGGLVVNALTYAPAQKLGQEIGSTAASAISQLCAGCVLLPFALMFGSGAFGVSGNLGVGWQYAAFTVLIFYVLSTSLWFYSLQGIKPWLNSALRCVGPVLAAPIAWIFFSKQLSMLQLSGAAIVILTSVLMVFKRSK